MEDRQGNAALQSIDAIKPEKKYGQFGCILTDFEKRVFAEFSGMSNLKH
jgi:hypothetical protein